MNDEITTSFFIFQTASLGSGDFESFLLDKII